MDKQETLAHPDSGTEAQISFEGVSKSFTVPGRAPHRALIALNLCIHRGEALCLIGSSGSGKTTLLRLINRLLDADTGRVLVEGRNVLKQDPIALRRSIGYVLQRGALFPHLTVRENVGLLCKLSGHSTERTRARVDELLEMVRIPASQFADRYPNELSGGQAQRVGVARALALNPGILLLDEPFGALDPITRRQLQQEFLELRRQQERTIVFVTHDLEEAFTLGDRVGILDQGELLQVGTPTDLQQHPVNDFVARFIEQNTSKVIA
jgi:osmoprotectant transport system ATP-binding protein